MAVVGIRDPVGGEVPKAFVELKERVTEEELIDFARKELEDYKVPVAVEVIEKLPRTASGKIARKQFSEQG